MCNQSDSSQTKSATSGLSDAVMQAYAHGTFVIYPPSGLYAELHRLRQKYHPNLCHLIGPHITVTQPLLAKLDGQGAQRISACINTLPPFTVTCGPATILGDTIIFDIEPKAEILRIRQMIHDTGLCNLSLPYTEGFIPHLTIGKADSPEEEVKKLRQPHMVTHFECTEIVYGIPDASFQFRPAQTFYLSR